MSKDVPEGAERSSGLAVPESVSVAVAELAEDLREGLLALAVGAGLQVMNALIEQDVAAACGPRGKHDPHRSAIRRYGTDTVAARSPWRAPGADHPAADARHRRLGRTAGAGLRAVLPH